MILRKKREVHKSILTVFLFGVLVILFFTLMVSAQVSPSPDKKIDSGMQLEIIDSVTSVFNRRYVFPEVSKRIEDNLRNNYRNGAYKDITSASEFSLILTDDMQKISNDQHIKIRYFPDEYFETELDQEPTEEELQRRLAEDRHNNFGFQKVEWLPGNVGYLKFDQFLHPKNAGPTAIAALNFLGYCDALIIDLRTNGGGEPSMVLLMLSYFFDEPKHTNSIYVRAEDRTEQLWTQAYVPGPRMSQVDVFLLTSQQTFSAAEDFSYSLKHLGRAMIVGETTGGGAHPVEYHNYRNLNMQAKVPYGRTINPVTNTNWEGIGVEPDIDVPQEEALDVSYLEALKKLEQETDNPDRKAQLKWVMEGLQVKLNPVSAPESQLQAYVGQYGPRKIWIDGGNLYYQREDRPKYKLIPMGDHKFMIKELDYFRVQFVLDDTGHASEIIGQYDSGRTDGHKRDK